MKKHLILIFLILLVSCSVKKKANDGKNGKDGMSSSSKHITITKMSIQKSMEFLASDALEGRATGSQGIEKAAVYIENFFKQNEIRFN